MNRSRKTLFAVVGTLAVAAAILVGTLGLTTSQVVLAQAPSPTPTTPSAGSTGTTNNATTVQKYWDFFWNSFSQAVNVDVAKLKAGFVNAADATVDQAVKDGIISQVTGDAIKTRIGNMINQGPAAGGSFPFFFGKGFGPGGRLGGKGFGVQVNLGTAEFAKALNMTQQALITELQAGKSIDDVAKEHNIDPAAVKASVLADVKSQLDAAVKSSSLTQAQADQIYSNVSSKIDAVMTENEATEPHGKGFPNNGNGAGNSNGSSHSRHGGSTGNGL